MSDAPMDHAAYAWMGTRGPVEIYALVDPSGRIFYVGATTFLRKRINGHWSGAARPGDPRGPWRAAWERRVAAGDSKALMRERRARVLDRVPSRAAAAEEASWIRVAASLDERVLNQISRGFYRPPVRRGPNKGENGPNKG